MNTTRRQIMMSMLFGPGLVGLRSLATGIPAAFFMDPRKAMAAGTCAASTAAQYLIFSTSINGDPVNANAPGCYVDPNIMHPQDPAMVATQMTLGATTTTAAAPWAGLPANVLSRSSFMHLASGTVVHPDEPGTLELNGGMANNEMLVSMIAAQLAPCLGTIQPYAMSLGATSTGEGLTSSGVPLPLFSPTTIASLLLAPSGPLAALEARRESDLQQISTLLSSQASPGQKQFLDQYVLSQQEISGISQNLITQLSAIKDNSVASQIVAALVLIQMKVAPVFTIHIPFGGDNHTDVSLVTETSQTVAGIASINALMTQLAVAGLQDQVTFGLLNVFGRTLNIAHEGYNGRDHNGGHTVALMIGKGIKGSVIGGVATSGPVSPGGSNFGNGHDTALPINSQTGLADLTSAADIAVNASLASFGQTLATAVGVNTSVISNTITRVKSSLQHLRECFMK